MPIKSEVTAQEIISYLKDKHAPSNEVDTIALRAAGNKFKISYPTVLKRLKKFKKGRGTWDLTALDIEKSYKAPAAEPVTQKVSYVPESDPNYVPFGNAPSLKKVINSGQFYPVFITGLSGNGKTLGVEQTCASLNRELIRVNITIETDEDDLIGGFRLVNGDTVWHNGPVVEALDRGAVLLLDEIDLASNKILCLQSVLEGKGIFLKKTGRYVKPAAGFTVIATANTKGKGSDDGRFVGTNVLNEAFLERFPITFEQEYPSPVIEQKILKNVGCELTFAENLVKWAGVIRKTFFDGGVDEVITTRRLVHIAQAYTIFGDRLQAITNCVNRFDDDTKQSFLDLYTKVDAGEDTTEENY
tara:strand:+ start:1815 stop:2888 length:1074 start_codon:yes stop_codon:yes gene_type:complete